MEVEKREWEKVWEGEQGGSKGGATSAGLVGIDRRRREWERKMKQRTKR